MIVILLMIMKGAYAPVILLQTCCFKDSFSCVFINFFVSWNLHSTETFFFINSMVAIITNFMKTSFF